MSYIKHYLHKAVHYIGDYTLGQTYVTPENREIEVTSGLDSYRHKEVELHEVLHKILEEVDEYKNRIKTRLMLIALGVTPVYH